jgi:hypothetical protein
MLFGSPRVSINLRHSDLELRLRGADQNEALNTVKSFGAESAIFVRVDTPPRWLAINILQTGPYNR